MAWTDWISPILDIAGGLASHNSSNNAANAAQYQPWSITQNGVGTAQYSGHQGMIGLDPYSQGIFNQISPLASGALTNFGNGTRLGYDYLNNSVNGANTSQQGLLGNLGNYVGGINAPQGADTGYGGQGFLGAGMNALNTPGNYTGNLITNFDPNQAANQYTNLLRQQALPQEQQAASGALSNLFNTGRLGTTGGMQSYQTLLDSQNQADIGRQVAGQQYGLQQQLLAQQGRDQALNAEQNRQINNYGVASNLANTGVGLLGQGFNQLQSLNQNQWDRQNQLYNASNSAVTDRFNRAMQLFGGNNALNQQDLSNFGTLLGQQQGINSQALDLARLGASVGANQTQASANAGAIRNQGNQDLISGFLDAWNRYQHPNGNGSTSGGPNSGTPSGAGGAVTAGMGAGADVAGMPSNIPGGTVSVSDPSVDGSSYGSNAGIAGAGASAGAGALAGLGAAPAGAVTVGEVGAAGGAGLGSGIAGGAAGGGTAAGASSGAAGAGAAAGWGAGVGLAYLGLQAIANHVNAPPPGLLAYWNGPPRTAADSPQMQQYIKDLNSYIQPHSGITQAQADAYIRNGADPSAVQSAMNDYGTLGGGDQFAQWLAQNPQLWAQTIGQQMPSTTGGGNNYQVTDPSILRWMGA